MKINSSAQATPSSSRAGIRRTVWILAACALGSYVLFLASVMSGR